MAEKETKIDLMEPAGNRDSKKIPPVQKEEDSPLPGATGKGTKKKPKKFILIIGLIGLALIGGGIGAAGYLGYLTIPGLSAATPSEPAPSEKLDIGEILKFSPLIINLNEENGRHYLKTTIVLELDEKKWAEKIQARMSVFTDTVILIVSEKKLEDTKTSDFKERLKEELLTAFNKHLGQKAIRQIYFDEFLFQ